MTREPATESPGWVILPFTRGLPAVAGMVRVAWRLGS
jgi:hypothetical protein